MFDQEYSDVVIIGGGLAGLAAAAYIARSGRGVIVLEKSRRVGGRAASRTEADFTFNLGPHALYAQGPGIAILRELGIQFSGGKPEVGGWAIWGGELRVLPSTPLSIMRSDLLSPPEKLSLVAALLRILRTGPEEINGVTVNEWLSRLTQSANVRALLLALSRLATYANAPHLMSAGVFASQLQMAIRENVYYLDGGWQSLVDGLAAKAKKAGAVIRSGAMAERLVDDEQGVSVLLRDGRRLICRAAILAVGPEQASRLMPDSMELSRWATESRPVQAAVLDLALGQIPRPDNRFALGVDQPLYYSLHSAYAQLAPKGGGLLQLAKYLDEGSHDPAETCAELEALADQLQPGWRDNVVMRRFLPRLTVANVLPGAEFGGLAGRPGYALPQAGHTYLAGDWIGPEGWLADASLASAKSAAHLALSQLTGKGEQMPV